ncbi:MAG TPA: hypothetical protein VES89_08615, partial [Candidatus Competibacteraceae bacterium]|nr:hypothetical protein [Candidatus Competibacteraceae bacterium]
KAYDTLMRDAPLAPVPQGQFWKWAYHPDTLATLCALRAALIRSDDQEEEPEAITVLRGISLGALHGPLHKGPTPSTYFSNQMMRSFALKPDYAVRFWTARGLQPPFADIRAIIAHRTRRLLQAAPPLHAPVQVRQGDAREPASYAALPGAIDWVVTSPPYLGMATYEVDQWLRLWFLGGPDHPVYRNPNQLSHHDASSFARALATVWDRIAEHASPSIRMVIRFGAIGSRRVDYSGLLRYSLELSSAPWRLTASRSAGHASKGRRQSLSMGQRGHSQALEERDFYVRL